MQNYKSKIKIDRVLVLLFTILVIVIIAQFTVFKNNKLNLGNNNKQDGPRVQQEDAKKDNNRVIIDFGDGRKIDQTLKADTPFKALEIIAGNQGYKINFKQYKYGLIVEEINKVKNNPTKFWIYSVNGVPAKIAADRYMLAEGDFVEWKYTSVK